MLPDDALAIYHAGPEVVVKTLCGFCDTIGSLENRITYNAHRTWFDEDPSKGSEDIVVQSFREKSNILFELRKPRPLGVVRVQWLCQLNSYILLLLC